MQKSKLKLILFLLFFMSGFCSLLYQVIWIRKAFGSFGIITPVLSIVISVFMMGLFIGSWFGDRTTRYIRERFGIAPITLYGFIELSLGLGALAVPSLYQFGESILLSSGQTNGVLYLFVSALVITISILPWTFLMGLTFPVMMVYLKEAFDKESASGFSYLYLANVIGAMIGVILSSNVLIELLGFTKTTYVAILGNFTIATLSFYLSRKKYFSSDDSSAVSEANIVPEVETAAPENSLTKPLAYKILFLTGFVSMGLEVIWTRAYTPVLKTTIYSFAFLLTIYLLATWLGSFLYRYQLKRKKLISVPTLIQLVFLTMIFSLVITDPRNPLKAQKMVTFSVFIFCLVLGYLTPLVIDRYSNGDPEKVGKAYAVNVLGCIFGPIFSGYFLLPFLGVKWSIVLMTAVVGMFVISTLKNLSKLNFSFLFKQGSYLTVGVLLLVLGSLFSVTYEYEGLYENAEIRRDYTATVISTGTGRERKLLVNGFGITVLNPVVKYMAHVPLAMLHKKPEKALVICFGMGTTFRSLLSWDIESKAVELIPSVVESFGYYHDDAAQVLKNPKAEVIIDDGRRYLSRTKEKFDLITIDPPPPIEAAGSGLLYSVEFMELARDGLTDGGILAHWFPGRKGPILNAVARSIKTVFPHVQVYKSIEGNMDFGGYHIFASMQPLKRLDATELESLLPEKAKTDLREWGNGYSINDLLTNFYSREVDFNSILTDNENGLISDDFPYNEYYKVRRILKKKGLTKLQDYLL